LGTIVGADVLIIGGGIAGLFAGIKAKGKEPSLDVLLVDKCYPGLSGSSVFAAGVYPNWQPGDEFDDYVREIIVDNAEYLIHQDYVEVAVKESYDRFRDMVDFGVEFLRDEGGEVERIPTLASRHGKCTPFKGGIQMTWNLRKEAVRRGVKMLDRIFINDLLMRDGQCVGAIGFHAVNGDGYVFKAKATVLAAGTLFFSRPLQGRSGSTGDSAAMAFRAGAQLRNMEQVGGTTIGPAFTPSPGLHVIFGNGGILVNVRGERFMERYEPRLLEEARRMDTAQAIVQEWRQGRGPCYVDCTHLPADKIAMIKDSLPRYAAALESAGLDLAKDRIEYIPYALGLQHYAGVRVNNADGDCGIPGLWTVATAGDFCGGCESTPAAALPGSSVQGARGGERAAEYAIQAPVPAPDMSQVRELRERILQPYHAEPTGIGVNEAARNLSRALHRYINVLKDEAMLRQALEEVARLKEEFGVGAAEDPHQLAKVHELKNMLLIAEVIAKSALIRTESRRSHHRLDYPQRDDKNWLRWVVAKLVNGKPELWTEEIPVGKWKYKPSV
jgi:succinate dehydrogenase/fumarate reductase flavoprotein subunit